MTALPRPPDWSNLTDVALVAFARDGDDAAIRLLIRRYNQRLFRVARAILPDDGAAEDAVQEAYLKAFSNLAAFRGDSAFATWLIRITMNEAYQGLRKARPSVEYDAISDRVTQSDGRVIAFPTTDLGVEEELMRRDVRRILEQAIGGLPEAFRIVFTLREMEGLSVREVAALLDLNLLTVKTRDYRARRLLRRHVEKALMGGFTAAFPFAGARCDEFSDRVLRELAARRAEP
ncbi:MAG: RNA polymerase sigma factor [Pseudorhodobacter sp.]|nr:RNA polymerase sigma factor [Pseudorhodobacter sp.]